MIYDEPPVCMDLHTMSVGYTDIDDTPRVCRVRDTPSTSYAVCVFWVLVDIVMRMNIKNKKSNEGLASRCGFRFGEGITRGHLQRVLSYPSISSHILGAALL